MKKQWTADLHMVRPSRIAYTAAKLSCQIHGSARYMWEDKRQCKFPYMKGGLSLPERHSYLPTEITIVLAFS